ncbi:MAG TPA: DNRLRE domain-containing protein, partial [Kiritimatiellia bacterium]|nr:DNRLRE domain-containing protein [Kiritimatiellia bacterium]
ANCIISNNNGSIKHGAVFNDWGNFTARDCTFANNTAINKGGAIINYGHDLTLLRCLFAGNTANNGGAVSFPNTSGSPSATNHNVIADCVFSNNTAAMDGGALLTDGNMSLTRCAFIGNHAGRSGTIATRGDTGFSQTWTNCLFAGNSSKNGSAICINGSSGPLGVIRAVNCTFATNTCIAGGRGGALYTMKPSTNASSVFEVVNCVFRGNFTNAIDRSGTTQPLPAVSHTDIDQAGYAGSNGNLNEDPLFVDAAGGNYRLQEGSLCIDAGTDVDAPTNDLAGVARPQGAGIDMGAYEFKVETTAPSIETRPATDVAAISATLAGDLTSAGGAATTVYAFWSSNLVSILPIDADTYLDSGKPTNNYGASGSAKVVASATPCRTLFTLPAAFWTNDAARIVSATVSFYTWSDNTAAQDVRLYPLTRAFAESGATWNTCDGANAWSSAGGDYDSGASVVGAKGALGVNGGDPNGRFFTWDITPLLSNPTTRAELQNYGALLDAGIASPQRYATFNSSDKTGYSQEYLPIVTVVLASPTTGQSANLGTCAEGALTHAVSGLRPNTAYTFTFLASNSAGTAWAPIAGSFTTATLAVEVNVTNVNVREAGGGRFFVRLNQDPGRSATVQISRSNGDEGLAIQSGATRSFTSRNWNTWQAVVLTAADDENDDGETTTFQIALNGANAAAVTATALDDDIGNNLALASAGSTIAGSIRPAELIDGIHAASANYGYTTWTNVPQGKMILDLKQSMRISRIRLLNWDWVYRVHRYMIESSPDGANWSALVDATGEDHQG